MQELRLARDAIVALPLGVPARQGTSVSSLLSRDSSHASGEGEWCNFVANTTADVAENVDVEKLLQPSSSKYYYSDANRSNRQLLDAVGRVPPMLGQVRNKKTLHRGLSLDAASILSERSQKSSYRGPTPLRRNGSAVPSALKRKPSAGKTTCSFSCVDIREYERVAGDNPCVRQGVPLAIGWAYRQHGSIDLEDYESHRGPPRDKVEMLVPAGVRERLLRDEFRVPAGDLADAVRGVELAKKQRGRTESAERFEGLAEAAECARRRLRRLRKGTSKGKEEEAVWAEARRNALQKHLEAQATPGDAGKGKGSGCPSVAPPKPNGHSWADMTDDMSDMSFGL